MKTKEITLAQQKCYFKFRGAVIPGWEQWTSPFTQLPFKLGYVTKNINPGLEVRILVFLPLCHSVEPNSHWIRWIGGKESTEMVAVMAVLELLLKQLVIRLQDLLETCSGGVHEVWCDNRAILKSQTFVKLLWSLASVGTEITEVRLLNILRDTHRYLVMKVYY